MPDTTLGESIADLVWDAKYRLRENGHGSEPDIRETCSRVALALSRPETQHRMEWYERFRGVLDRFRFLPGGRILANAGTPRRATLFNCFASGQMQDSIDGIFSNLSETMLTLQAGGGVGCDFSALRPAGMRASSSGNIASGPLSFLQVWDQACAALASTGGRHGALTAALRCDHPDIRRFINARREPGMLRHVSLSVLVTDAFMRAVEEDDEWPLMFPLGDHPVPPGGRVCERVWPGSISPQTCLVADTVRARALWEELQKAAFECGDPAVVFIDRMQRDSNLYYTEAISTPGAGGMIPLPSHGACNLGSINLAQFVSDPFGAHAKPDFQGLMDTTAVAVRMLDNVYDIEHFPVTAQQRTALATRRIGLGVTGLADMLAMLGVRYGSSVSLEIADKVMETICHAAYRTSTELARERGAFGDYRRHEYLNASFIRSLPADIVDAIARDGIRNSHLLAIAPAESISLLASNVSCGIAPIRALACYRNIATADGSVRRVFLRDYAWAQYCARFGENMPVSHDFTEAAEIAAIDQLKVQAVVMAHVDQAATATATLPADADFHRFPRYADLFDKAYQLGLKGCSISRPHAHDDDGNGHLAA